MTILCQIVTWRPHVSDPTVMAWIITLAFLAAGGVCLRRFRRTPGPRRVSAFWMGSAVFFILLGLNKQLDFQVLLIQLGRAWTNGHHWFERRRLVQTVFVILLSVAAAGGSLAYVWTLRTYWARIRLALIGVACSLAVAVLRAAVICHLLDRVIYAVGTTPSTVHHSLEPLELVGPLCVIASVWFSLKGDQMKSRTG